MAEKNPQLKPKANIDYEIELQYDDCKTGENDYGQWYMYKVKHEGKEYIFFPTQYLHSQLMCYSKGDILKIRKEEREDGKGFNWHIKAVNCNSKHEFEIPDDKSNPPEYAKKIVDRLEKRKEPDWDLINGIKSWDIHIQVAAKLASRTLPAKWSNQTAAKRTDEWLAIISNHYRRATEHIKLCENVFELRGVWEKYKHIWSELLSEDEFLMIEGLKDARKLAFEEPEETPDDVPF